MKKVKYRRITRGEFNTIISLCKAVSSSLADTNIIIKQFNILTSSQRSFIIKEYNQREDILKKQIFTKNDDLYSVCLIVNLHIIASKYNIDPATIALCISKLCKENEKILVL